MKITIKLFATLRDFGPGIKEVSVSENSTIEKIVKSFNLPEETPLLTIVNGVHTDPKEMLKQRDVLGPFSSGRGWLAGHDGKFYQTAFRQP